MTAKQTESIVRLLLTLCPARQPRIGKDFAAAWVAALKPYDYDAVKAAALDYARKKVFFPAVSDILAAVPPPLRNDLDRARELLHRAKAEHTP